MRQGVIDTAVRIEGRKMKRHKLVIIDSSVDAASLSADFSGVGWAGVVFMLPVEEIVELHRNALVISYSL
jgi:hypothetical protein